MVIHIRTFIVALIAIGLISIGALGTYAADKLLAQPPSVSKTVALQPEQKTVAPAHPSAVTPAVIATPAATPPAPVTSAIVPVPAALPVPPPVPRIVPAVQPGHILVQVIDVRPHYKTKIIAYPECYMEPRTVYVSPGAPSGVGAVLGGVTGGIVGNQFGGGKGKVATTIGGAILGTVMGNQVENGLSQPQPRTTYVRVCHTEHVRKTVRNGYEVTYLYDGQKNTMIMKHRPEEDIIAIPVAVLNN